MTKSVLVAAVTASIGGSAGSTNYAWVGNAPLTLSTTEANRQVIYRAAGTFSDIYARISANATTANSTITFRKNAAAGNMTFTVAGGATGEFVESTPHTDTIAAADKVNYQIVSGTGGALSIQSISVVFAPTTTTDTYTRIVSGQPALTTASSTLFQYLTNNGSPVWNATESQTQFKWKVAGTMKNLARYNTSIRTTATTYRSRKNTANGGMSLTPSGTAPLWFEDTTNSDTIAVNDLWNYSITTGTGTTTDTGNTVAVDFYNTNNDSVFICTSGLGPGNNGTSYTQGTTSYVPLAGTASSTPLLSIEANAQTKARVGSGDGTVTLSNLSVLIASNSVTVGQNSTVDLRKNAASTAATITVAGGTTGWLHDTTNTDTVSNTTDELNYRVVNGDPNGGTHTIAIGHIAVYMDITVTQQNITKTLTETVGPISESLTIQRTKQRAVGDAVAYM